MYGSFGDKQTRKTLIRDYNQNLTSNSFSIAIGLHILGYILEGI